MDGFSDKIWIATAILLMRNAIMSVLIVIMSVFDDMQAIEYDKKVDEYSKKTDSCNKNMIAANKMPAEYRKMMIECCKTNILNGDNMLHGAQIRIIIRPTCMIYVQLLKKKILFLLQIIKIAVSLQNLN